MLWCDLFHLLLLCAAFSFLLVSLKPKDYWNGDKKLEQTYGQAERFTHSPPQLKRSFQFPFLFLNSLCVCVCVLPLFVSAPVDNGRTASVSALTWFELLTCPAKGTDLLLCLCVCVHVTSVLFRHTYNFHTYVQQKPRVTYFVFYLGTFFFFSSFLMDSLLSIPTAPLSFSLDAFDQIRIIRRKRRRRASSFTWHRPSAFFLFFSKFSFFKTKILGRIEEEEVKRWNRGGVFESKEENKKERRKIIRELLSQLRWWWPCFSPPPHARSEEEKKGRRHTVNRFSERVKKLKNNPPGSVFVFVIFVCCFCAKF